MKFDELLRTEMRAGILALSHYLFSMFFDFKITDGHCLQLMAAAIRRCNGKALSLNCRISEIENEKSNFKK